jgi:hypothetical protein
MQFKELAEKLGEGCPVPLEGTVIQRENKRNEAKIINTFVLRTLTRPTVTIYRKNLRTEPAEFLAREVPPRVLENIQQKIGAM